MESFWKNKKIVVLGGGGFVGSHLVEELQKKDVKVLAVVRKKTNNLKFVKKQKNIIVKEIKTIDECRKIIRGSDIVINCIARVGGIEFNSLHPAKMFFENTYLGLIILEAVRLENISNYTLVSSVDVYPSTAKIPIKEKEGHVGMPDHTTISYGWAKRISELQAKFYHQEYGMKISVLRPSGIYGPRDYFEKDKSHVIPALIMKVDDEENQITVWGSGNQKRVFTYVKDTVKGILDATEKCHDAKPINLASKEEITIKKLAELIIKKSGKKLKINFDKTKPEGYKRTLQDTTLAKSQINWNPKYSLEKGIDETIKWYKKKN